MSERREGPWYYDTSNPCSDPITGVANEDARLRKINAGLLTALKAMVKCNERSEAGERIDDEPAVELAYTAIAKAEQTEEDVTPPLTAAKLKACDNDFLEDDPKTGGITFHFDPEPQAVTSDQVAKVFAKTIDPGDRSDKIGSNEYTFAVLESMADSIADLYAAADPAFDREEFLRRCSG